MKQHNNRVTRSHFNSLPTRKWYQNGTKDARRVQNTRCWNFRHVWMLLGINCVLGMSRLATQIKSLWLLSSLKEEWMLQLLYQSHLVLWQSDKCEIRNVVDAAEDHVLSELSESLKKTAAAMIIVIPVMEILGGYNQHTLCAAVIFAKKHLMKLSFKYESRIFSINLLS